MSLRNEPYARQTSHRVAIELLQQVSFLKSEPCGRSPETVMSQYPGEHCSPRKIISYRHIYIPSSSRFATTGVFENDAESRYIKMYLPKRDPRSALIQYMIVTSASSRFVGLARNDQPARQSQKVYPLWYTSLCQGNVSGELSFFVQDSHRYLNPLRNAQTSRKSHAAAFRDRLLIFTGSQN
jgi:hypothetical protein